MDWNMNKQFQEQNASKFKYMQAFSESLLGVRFRGWTKKGLIDTHSLYKSIVHIIDWS